MELDKQMYRPLYRLVIVIVITCHDYAAVTTILMQDWLQVHLYPFRCILQTARRESDLSKLNSLKIYLHGVMLVAFRNCVYSKTSFTFIL